MIIYKKDTKGKIRSLEIQTICGTLIQTSGIVGGKMVEHSKQCKSKNIGKSNYTSGKAQAIKEAEALITKKLREGYFNTIGEAESIEVVMPMLAHSYEKYKDKIDWGNCYVQPKLDGMRCLAFLDGKGGVKLMSRKGVEITTMPHIVSSLSSIKTEMILDGELYAHGLSFQENMKLIKKNREDSIKVKYHFYDIIKNTHYADRLDNLARLGRIKYALRVDTYPLKSFEDLLYKHAYFIEKGYEGSIIRHGITGYKKNGRSSSLLKYKDFIDETYEIVDVVPMEVRPEQGVVVCVTSEGKEFKATPKMSFADREHLLSYKEEVIGKTAEIRFFEYTDDGLPRFPIYMGTRLDK